jgi:hypothetical protein
MIEQLLSITIPVLHPVPPANAGLYVLIAEDGPQSARPRKATASACR